MRKSNLSWRDVIISKTDTSDGKSLYYLLVTALMVSTAGTGYGLQGSFKAPFAQTDRAMRLSMEKQSC